MAESRQGPGSTRPTWILVGVLLAIPIVVPLLVWTYDTATPELFGFPFFFWYQFALIVMAGALTFAAFKLSEKASAQDHENRAAAKRSRREGGDQS